MVLAALKFNKYSKIPEEIDMADLAITAANVVRGVGAKVETGIAGAVITAGQSVYKDPADGDKFKPADADSATATVRTTRGIALNGAANNQPLAVQVEGRIVIGGTVAPGTVYVQSDTPGGIMPAADLEAGDYVTVLGVGVSATEIDLNIHASGVTV
jgi:hypothetical protein